MIKFTEAALEKVEEFGKDHPTAVLRIGVAGGGCSGFEYKMGFIEEEEVDETFSKYEQEDVPFVVDKKGEPFIDGCTVDWIEDTMKRGFKFDNPNATGGCGCGTSFSV